MTAGSGKRDCVCAKSRHQHGTRAAYNRDHCRCFKCRLANSEARLAKQYGNDLYVTSHGIQRRLQALHAIGWSSAEIARVSGVHRNNIRHMRMGLSGKNTRWSLQKITEVYDQLSMTRPSPTTPQQKRSVGKILALAKRNGWVPPLAWDEDTIDDPTARPSAGEPVDMDEVAIEEVCVGRISRDLLTREELAEAVRRLAGRGYSDADIADRLGYERSSVSIIRARLGIAPAIPSNRPVVAA